MIWTCKFAAAAAVFGLALGAAAGANAAVTVLDFTNATCSGAACSDGDRIDQTYGDSAGVDVSYATFSGGQPFQSFLQYWSVAFGDLSGVVWGGDAGSTSQITFTAAPGYEVSLLAFDIATNNRAAAAAQIAIQSLGGNAILATNVNTQFPNHNSVTVSSAYFTDGITLDWGVGNVMALDNIAFDVRAIGGTGVPEPATWAMLILGFAAAGSSIRRRRALAA